MVPIYVGDNVELWNHGPVYIDGDRHIFIIGKSGSGKSTIIRKIIKTLMDEGRSVIVVDPHGALVDACMKDGNSSGGRVSDTTKK